MSALLQLHLHSPLNTWLQYVAQRQLQANSRSICVLGFGASYIVDFTVYGIPMACNYITLYWNHNSNIVWILLACVYEGQLLYKLHLLYCGIITRTSTQPTCMTHTHTWEQWIRCSESRSERTISDESITGCEIVMRDRGQLAAGFYIAQCNVSCSGHVHICLTMYTWSNQKVTWSNTCPFVTDHM